jgi:acyl carrier protein
VRPPPERALRRVRQVLRSALPHLPARALRPDARLMGDLGVDSLKVAELSVAMESAFDRAIFLGDLFAEVDDPSQLTVADLAHYLARQEEAG